MYIDFTKLEHKFSKKPLVVGGRAMEYYGLRKSGKDIDLIVPAEDVDQLIQRFPDRVKDLWGDLGVCPYEFEIWKTICLFDYNSLSEGATDLGDVLMISLDKLLLMKALAMDKEKYLEDTKLVVRRILDDQYRHYDQRKAENDQIQAMCLALLSLRSPARVTNTVWIVLC
jgi:hypothetical protein